MWFDESLSLLKLHGASHGGTYNLSLNLELYLKVLNF